jgi:hypothetical protein
MVNGTQGRKRRKRRGGLCFWLKIEQPCVGREMSELAKRAANVSVDEYERKRSC